MEGRVGAITAVVLAGGPQDALAAQTPGAPNKAFVDIGGTPLVERTLRALKNSTAIGKIIVVAPVAAHGSPALSLADEKRPDGKFITQSMQSGLRDLPPEADVLVSASDLPVLTAQSVGDFVARALAKDADLTYGCIERSVHMNSFPQAPHTWARLRDGTFCGTGFVTIRPRVWPRLQQFIEQLGRARKNPLRLATLFGWNILALYALRRLTIERAQRRASEVLGAKVRAVISPYPEIGINVDRVSDIAMAEDLVAKSPSV